MRFSLKYPSSCVILIALTLFSVVSAFGQCDTPNYADIVISQTGVTNPSYALGVANSSSAELYDQNDQLVLDLSDTLPTSVDYTITWRRDPGTSSTPSVSVEESIDGSSWTIASGSPFAPNNTSYFNQTITPSTNTRYLRFTTLNVYNVDVDAVTYTIPCPATCNSGIDNDNDGIYNDCDLDDDNDGILDANEGCGNNNDISGTIGIGNNVTNSVYNLTGTTITYSISTTGSGEIVGYDAGLNGHAIRIHRFNNPGDYSGTINTTYSNPVGNVHFKLTDFDEQENYTVNVYDENDSLYDLTTPGLAVVGSNITQVGNVFSASNPPNVDGNDPAQDYLGSVLFYFPNKVSRIDLVFIHVETTIGGNASIRFTQPSFCSVDTDGDNILDYLDLDSDNDGCPDALEGDGSFGIADILNDTLTGGLDQDGIPLVTNGGQNNTAAVTDSTDAIECACYSTFSGNLDNDNDGIADHCDLDDDNDGIPDVIESPCDGGLPDLATLYTDGTTTLYDSTTTLTTSVFGVGTSTPTGTAASTYIALADEDADFFDATNSFNNYAVIRLEFSKAVSLTGTFNLIDIDWTQRGSVFGSLNGTLIPFNLTAINNTTVGTGTLVNQPSGVTSSGSFPVLNSYNSGTNYSIDATASFDNVLIDNIYFIWNIATNFGSTSSVRIDMATTDLCIPIDTDNDGIPNQFDIDADNDGIPDVVEAGGTDVDGDGIADGFVDTDNDGLNDIYDNDNGGTDILADDTDGDAIPDYLDLDADNDGIPDVVEAGGTDVNGNGIADGFVDTDNDGLNDIYDNDNGGTEIFVDDTDADGIPDYLDIDSDNDGIPDVVEAGGTNANGDGRADNYVDADADGFNDLVDGDPTNALAAGDDSNGSNSSAALVLTGTDTDGDGEPNSFPNNDTDGDAILDHLDIDTDNDGILDLREVQAGDAGSIGGFVSLTGIDSDGDGMDDSFDPDQTDGPLTTSTPSGTPIGPSNSLDDFDGDGVPNHKDIDADNDGILDLIESSSANDFSPFSSLDSDGDGLIDALNDSELDGISGSTGTIPNDDLDDADGAADYIDLNSDGDIYNDAEESFDFNKDGMSVNDYIYAADIYNPINGGADTSNYNSALNSDNDIIPDFLEDDDMDGQLNFLDPDHANYSDVDMDGLVDLLDSDQNSSTPFSGILIPGTITPYPVDSDDETDPQSDWRDASTFTSLPVTMLYFEVSKINENDALLNWATTLEFNNKGFEIYRSMNNGSSFDYIGFVNGSGNSTTQREYNFIDPSIPRSGISDACYKMKQIDFDGKSEMTKIECIRFSNFEELVEFNNGLLNFNFDNKKLPNSIYLVNMSGQIVMELDPDNKTYDFNDLNSGIYILSINFNNEILSRKIVSAH